MTNKISIFGFVAAAALVAGLASANSVAAQMGNPPAGAGASANARGAMAGQMRGTMSNTMNQSRGNAQRGGMFGGQQVSPVSVAADKLGLSLTDLVAQLNGGKTIAQLAQEKGLALDEIVNGVLEPRTTQLNAQVAAGRITQAQADQILATMRVQMTAQLSQPWQPRGAGNGQRQSAFVDGNGDGLCDNQPAHSQPMQRGPRGRWNR